MLMVGAAEGIFDRDLFRSFWVEVSDLEPFFDRVARQPGEFCDCTVGEFFTQFHAPDLTYHVHTDHLFALLKIQHSSGTTLVNFGSALLGLGG